MIKMLNGKKSWKESCRKGNEPGYHLLNKCELTDFIKDYFIADFRNTYGVPYDYLVAKAKGEDKRLRLSSPYVEHLSQAYARFFMRVGLSVDIPSFK